MILKKLSTHEYECYIGTDYVGIQLDVWNTANYTKPYKLRIFVSGLKPAPKNGVPLDAKLFYFRRIDTALVDPTNGETKAAAMFTVPDMNKGLRNPDLNTAGAAGSVWLNTPDGWPNW